MKKFILGVGLLLAVSLFGAASVSAQTTSTSLALSANIPAATGATVAVSSVNPTTLVFTPVTGTALTFDPMALNSQFKIFLPNHFFAIDIGVTGGAGSVNTTVTYTDALNPNAPAHGLGWKSTATFVKVTGATGSQTETFLTTHGPKKMLKDLTGETINSTEITGGFLRVYLGIVTGDPNANPKEPTGAEVFTTADKGGNYTGTLVVSNTLL